MASYEREKTHVKNWQRAEKTGGQRMSLPNLVCDEGGWNGIHAVEGSLKCAT